MVVTLGHIGASGSLLAHDPHQSFAIKVSGGGCFRRLHARGLIAKISAHAPLARHGLRPPGDGHVAVSARASLPQRLRHSSSGLIFFAKDKELTAKESILSTDHAEAEAELMNRVIEDEIRKMPAQYLWVHKRFKTRPHGEAPIY